MTFEWWEATLAGSADKKKLCFVVGPIGDDDSDERIHADWLLEEIIEPVFAAGFSNFVVERADRVSNPGMIDSQMITSLLNAELVIADLTFLNPNAFYEIGIRHMAQKPIIHMHLAGQKIPFDVGAFRSIKFARTRPRDIRAAREALSAFVASVTAPDYSVDNPVTFARGRAAFEQGASTREKVILDELESLKRRLGAVETEPRQSVWGSSFSPPISSVKEYLATFEREQGTTPVELFRFVQETARPLLGGITTERNSDDRIEFELQARIGRSARIKLTTEAKAAGVKFKLYDKDGGFVAGVLD